MAKTVIAVFRDARAAEAALEDLLQDDFRRSDVSIVAKDTRENVRVDYDADDAGEGAAAGAGFGALLGAAAGLLAGLGALTIPGIGPIVAAGPIAAALAGAGVGAAAGGITGALVDWGVPSEDAHVYGESVRRGGILLSVRTTDERAGRAAELLENNDPVDVSRHARVWREEEGWTGFDETAGELTGDEMTIALIEEDTVEIGHEGQERMVGEAPVRQETHQRLATDGAEAGRPEPRTWETEDVDDTGYSDYESAWQRHWRTHYAETGRDFQDYRGAYVYGCRLYDADVGDWRASESEARRYWMENYPDRRWEDYRDAVREGFMVCERL